MSNIKRRLHRVRDSLSEAYNLSNYDNKDVHRVITATQTLVTVVADIADAVNALQEDTTPNPRQFDEDMVVVPDSKTPTPEGFMTREEVQNALDNVGVINNRRLVVQSSNFATPTMWITVEEYDERLGDWFTRPSAYCSAITRHKGHGVGYQGSKILFSISDVAEAIKQFRIDME